MYFLVLMGTLRYLWALRGTFRYFEVLLGTLRYFLVLWGTLRYFLVLLGTYRHFQVPLGIFRYFQVFLGTSRYLEIFLGSSKYFQVLWGYFQELSGNLTGNYFLAVLVAKIPYNIILLFLRSQRSQYFHHSAIPLFSFCIYQAYRAWFFISQMKDFCTVYKRQYMLSSYLMSQKCDG